VLIADILQPGKKIKDSIRTEMLSNYSITNDDITKKINTRPVSPLQILENMVPNNIFQSASSNQNMIQVVLFAILFGIGLSRIMIEKSRPVLDFLEGVNEVFTVIVKFIMHFAPIGVFALVASVIAQTAGNDVSYTLHILSALLYYCFCVLIGLSAMLLIVYPIIIRIFSGIPYKKFFTAMRPAFLLAFTSGSSNATLPITMQCVEENLKVKKDISRFVLPMGTTINMDGTALYQCVAAIFIAQFFTIDLSVLHQITIILTATLGAIGAAGVPGAGMITLTMVLQSAGIPLAGINLILIPDRFLDMCRTVVNVAGDATTCLVVQGKNSEP
jgi:Na+/H+-dicarboxylate symporter